MTDTIGVQPVGNLGYRTGTSRLIGGYTFGSSVEAALSDVTNSIPLVLV